LSDGDRLPEEFRDLSPFKTRSFDFAFSFGIPDPEMRYQFSRRID
jgi:hypothetical protein